MSEPPTKARRNVAKSRVLKIRQNISIYPSILKLGKKKALKAGFSFSTYVERLIREN